MCYCRAGKRGNRSDARVPTYTYLRTRSRDSRGCDTRAFLAHDFATFIKAEGDAELHGCIGRYDQRVQIRYRTALSQESVHIISLSEARNCSI